MHFELTQCNQIHGAEAFANSFAGQPIGQILRLEGMHFNLKIAVERYLRDELAREQPLVIACSV
jgi:hypothetical protein